MERRIESIFDVLLSSKNKFSPGNFPLASSIILISLGARLPE
ncbi:Uncharacterised protein [Segatella copri]|nr:Uncharacterised protein [Segatella copri]